MNAEKQINKSYDFIKSFEDITSVRDIYSPDEKNVFALCAKANYKKNTYDNALFIYKNKKIKKICKFDLKEEFVCFFDDFIVTKKRDRYKIISLFKPKKTAYAFKTKHKLKKIFCIEKGCMYALCEIKNKSINNKYSVFTSSDEIFENGDADFKAGKISALLAIDILKKKIKYISKQNQTVNYAYYDKEKKEICFTVKNISENFCPYSKAYVFSIKDCEKKAIYTDLDFDFESVFPFKDSYLAVGSDDKAYGINQNPSFYIADNGTLRLYCANDLSVDNSVNTDVRYDLSGDMIIKDDTLYFLSTRRDSCHIYKLTDGKIQLYYDGLSCVEKFIFAKGRLFAVGLDGSAAHEIYAFDGNKTRQVSNFNTVKDYKPVKIDYKYKDYPANGYVIYPPNFDKTKSYPAVFQVHGGPKTTYTDVFFYEMYALSLEGYIVFFTNPPGSDNFDNEFADIRGKYGQTDYECLMEFFHLILEKCPQIDKTRVAVSGGSYGGFMVNCMTGKTDEFRCAITQRSISNWVSFYATSDIGTYFSVDQLGVSSKDFQKLWEFSPLKNVDNVKTPTLVIHSSCDYRCPLEQGLQWYVNLKENRVPSRLLILKGQNHDLSRTGDVKHRILRLFYMICFLNENLKHDGD